MATINLKSVSKADPKTVFSFNPLSDYPDITVKARHILNGEANDYIIPAKGRMPATIDFRQIISDKVISIENLTLIDQAGNSIEIKTGADLLGLTGISPAQDPDGFIFLNTLMQSIGVTILNNASLTEDEAKNLS